MPTIPWCTYHIISTIPYHTIPYLPCNTIPYIAYHTIRYTIPTILYNTIPNVPYNTVPLPPLQRGPARARRVVSGYHVSHQVSRPFHPSREAQSEQGIKIPCNPSGIAPLPLQGSPAGRESEEVSGYNAMYQVSCPSSSHPSQGALPERGGSVSGDHVIYQVSHPSHPSREAPPERGGRYRDTCYVSSFVPLPPLQQGPATRARRASRYHVITTTTSGDRRRRGGPAGCGRPCSPPPKLSRPDAQM